MKITFWLGLTLALAGSRANAQTPLPPKDGTPTIVEAGPHERVWRSVAVDGAGRTNIHSYVELATGLNYFNSDTGKWEESREQFEIARDGSAMATHGQHQAILAGDINSGGSVDLRTPDGQRLRSNPMGLSFRDLASGKTVLIAEVTNCVGELVAPNEVVYANAFDTIKAAIRYKNTKAGFSQDIILYQNPGSPADYGLNPDTTLLEIYTEFSNPPTPVVEPGSDNDQTLDFGQMRIGRGAAYLLSNQNLEGFVVTKEWAQIQGRNFLIESVPYQQVKPLLDDLQASVSRENKDAVAMRAVANREKLVALEGM